MSAVSSRSSANQSTQTIDSKAQSQPVASPTPLASRSQDFFDNIRLRIAGALDNIRHELVPSSIVPKSIEGRGGEIVSRLATGNLNLPGSSTHTAIEAATDSKLKSQVLERATAALETDDTESKVTKDPLTPEQIKELKSNWKEYLEKCGKKFKELLAELGIDVKTATGTDIEKAIFKKFDTDGDGVLTGEEAIPLIKAIMPWGIARGFLIGKLEDLKKGKFMALGDLAKSLKEMQPILAQLEKEGLLPPELVALLTRQPETTAPGTETVEQSGRKSLVAASVQRRAA